MRIGCCIPGGSFMPQDNEKEMDALTRLTIGAQMILDNGFDFAEGTVGMIMALSEEQLQEAAGKVRLAACNSFIPGRGTVIEGGDSLRQYVFEAMRRLNVLQCPLVVFGSGAARTIPEDMPWEEGMRRVREFLEICQEAGEKYGVEVALEPLNKKETNMMNTVSDAIEMCKEYGLSRITVLADAYHMAQEKEDLAHMKDAGALLRHVHVSEADRSCPGSTDDLRVFAAALKEAGYDGDVSAECIYTDFSVECGKAARYMKEVFK